MNLLALAELMNQSGRRVSEIVGIVDPVVALRVDLAAVMEWRRNEGRRERERREYRAREIEVLGLLFLSAQGGGEHWPDVRALLGLTDDDPADAAEGFDFSEEAMRKRVAEYQPTPGEREYVDKGKVFELRKRQARALAAGDAGKVEIIVNGEPRLMPYPPPGYSYGGDGELHRHADGVVDIAAG